MDFEPTLLRAFVAVCETGGFTRAAQRLHLTQSAVSHQIRRLEEQVGRQLLYRTTRKLTLTEDGEDFLRHAEQILQGQEALTRRFHSSTASGAIRLGVPENFIGDRLPQLLGRFARQYPAVRLEVSVSVCLDLRAKVDAGELDLAVAITRSDAEGGTVLRQTQFVWAAAESFKRPQNSSLPFALSPPPCALRAMAVEALTASGIDWHVGFTSANQHGLRAAVQAGLAVSIFAQEEIEPWMTVLDANDGLPPLPEAKYVLISKQGDQMPCAAELGRLIVDEAGFWSERARMRQV
ncbi:LysR family transcriptional regulator [Afipia massiliensis]|uniref:LysR family transcriptional regulator n=1 Tax=Afipia massiliensis TaxID=211460 RepID=A0A4U6BW07_9BRAD|nr:LysR family transcriptional regulator [Afipia massiliensis]TKT73368.1 LysR family transcriptional regulator [Afipia massiliensis]